MSESRSKPYRSMVLPAMLLAACSGGSDNTGPVTADTAMDYCRMGCEHDFECAGTPDPEVDECVAACAGEVVGVFREDVFVHITECMVGLECGASEDSCLQCQPTDAHNTYEARCHDALATCLATDELDQACEVTPDFEADIGFNCFLATPIMEELTACLDSQGCEAQLSCLQAVYDRLDV